MPVPSRHAPTFSLHALLTGLLIAFITAISLLAGPLPRATAATSELSKEGEHLASHLEEIFSTLGVTISSGDLRLLAYRVYGPAATALAPPPTSSVLLPPLPTTTAPPASRPGTGSTQDSPGQDTSQQVPPTDRENTAWEDTDWETFDPFATHPDHEHLGANYDPEIAQLFESGDDPGPALSYMEYTEKVNRSFGSPAFSGANYHHATTIDGALFYCPVDGPTRFINDWGFPRSKGRSHRGTDVFAQRGTPVVAVSSGTVIKVDRVDNYVRGSGVGDLGGITLWLRDDLGNTYYYAHLNSIDSHIDRGTRVEQGARLGAVGNTGNAITTPPHLHFQVHPGAGQATNPYPYLRPACNPTNNPLP